MVALSSDKDKKNWRRFDGTSERKELSNSEFNRNCFLGESLRGFWRYLSSMFLLFIRSRLVSGASDEGEE